MKIALVHDFLMQDGGAENVLEAMQEVWPQAPTYTLFFDPKKVPRFEGRDIRTSFLQQALGVSSRYQWYLPLMPTATERYDLSAFDVIISSSSAFSKGVIVPEGAVHICYCHTPTRYLWTDANSYVDSLRLPRPIRALIHPLLSHLRVWDAQAANRVDHFIANSQTVQKRIAKYYRKPSVIIHPPVDTHHFAISEHPKTYFLTGGRLVAYKQFDLIIEAANQTGLPLKIFGTGPLFEEFKARAASNVELLGRVSDAELVDLYSGAKAFLHPHIEDFGITPVESMAAGRPVIAWPQGGATETIIEGVTGQFLSEQTWEELADQMIRFDAEKWDPNVIRAHAQTFSRARFKQELKELVENLCTSPLTPDTLEGHNTQA